MLPAAPPISACRLLQNHPPPAQVIVVFLKLSMSKSTLTKQFDARSIIRDKVLIARWPQPVSSSVIAASATDCAAPASSEV
jgi:hypothetical protein